MKIKQILGTANILLIVDSENYIWIYSRNEFTIRLGSLKLHDGLNYTNFNIGNDSVVKFCRGINFLAIHTRLGNLFISNQHWLEEFDRIDIKSEHDSTPVEQFLSTHSNIDSD